MTLSYVLMQNLRRNPLRSLLTAAAFALPMAVFVAAISLVAAFVRVSEINERELRLAVRHRTSLTLGLPEGMRRRIEALDPERQRLRAVCGMRWFGGRVPKTQNTLTSLAADRDTFPVVHSDLEMTPADIEAWDRYRIAAVSGPAPAELYGWKTGDRIVLESSIPPYLQLEFQLVKIVPNKDKANNFWFRRDYLVESLKERGIDDVQCNIFWVKCQSAAALRSLQQDIDTAFANSPEATKSEDENAFGANFVQAMGDIPGLMRAMAIVVVLIVALVAGNTMMMSFRERMRELAVFKAIGFSSGRIFRIVLMESVLLALVGSAAGILPAAVFLYLAPIKGLRMGPVASLELSVPAVLISLAIGTLVGLAAGLWPAFQALRLKTVHALRRIG
jgi:putative ABC transport system permease protein